MRCWRLASSKVTRTAPGGRSIAVTVVMPDMMIQESLEIVQRARVLFRVTRRLRAHGWTGAGSVGRRFMTAVPAIKQGSLA